MPRQEDKYRGVVEFAKTLAIEKAGDGTLQQIDGIDIGKSPEDQTRAFLALATRWENLLNRSLELLGEERETARMHDLRTKLIEIVNLQKSVRTKKKKVDAFFAHMTKHAQ